MYPRQLLCQATAKNTFLQPNYQTLWKRVYNGIADATFITGLWIAIMKASAEVLASLLLKIILNLAGIQKMLEVAKMFTPSLSFWQYLFYPQGSQWWTNWSSVRRVYLASVTHSLGSIVSYEESRAKGSATSFQAIVLNQTLLPIVIFSSLLVDCIVFFLGIWFWLIIQKLLGLSKSVKLRVVLFCCAMSFRWFFHTIPLHSFEVPFTLLFLEKSYKALLITG